MYVSVGPTKLACMESPLGSKTSKTTPVGGWPAKIIAERLLRELAIAGKA
jgi:hypothetical protein